MSTPLTPREIAEATPPIRRLPCPFCGVTNLRAQLNGALLQVHCLTCGAAYRLPLEAITSATPPLHTLVCELLSMLQNAQLAPGFSNEDWLAWLAKARRAVQSPALPES